MPLCCWTIYNYLKSVAPCYRHRQITAPAPYHSKIFADRCSSWCQTNIVTVLNAEFTYAINEFIRNCNLIVQTSLCWASYLGSQNDATCSCSSGTCSYQLIASTQCWQLSINICCLHPGCGRWPSAGQMDTLHCMLCGQHQKETGLNLFWKQVYMSLIKVNTAQLMPLPLTVSCFSKIQIGVTFPVQAHPGSPGQRAVKWVCVCVCLYPGFEMIQATGALW